MALQFMDGFDAGDFTAKWMYSSNGGNALTTSTTTRFGQGSALSAGSYGTSSLATLGLTPAAQIFVGFALASSTYTGASGNGYFCRLFTDLGATVHLQFQTTAGNVITVFRNGTQIAAGTIPQTSQSSNYWVYIEISATINSTTGTCIVRANGTQVINFSGNTRNGGTSTSIDTVSIGGNAYTSYDDLYICDATGTTNNTFLGDVRVQTLLPSGAGSSTALTPVGGANYANVNDIPDSSSTYNYSSVSGARDTYQITDLLAGTGSVYAVQDNIHAFKTNSGQAGIKPALKSGATVYYDATKNLSPSNVWYGSVRETDPATGAPWTVSGVNAAEFGGEVA